MQLKLFVITQSHEKWPARGERLAGEAFSLVCQDMSQPAEHRMSENVTYRLKPEEVEKHWNKCLDKPLTVVCRRITHNQAGKASLIGEIIGETK